MIENGNLYKAKRKFYLDCEAKSNKKEIVYDNSFVMVVAINNYTQRIIRYHSSNIMGTAYIVKVFFLYKDGFLFHREYESFVSIEDAQKMLSVWANDFLQEVNQVGQ